LLYNIIFDIIKNNLIIYNNKKQELNEESAIYNDKQRNLFWDLEENKKTSETLHQTNDVFSESNNSTIKIRLMSIKKFINSVFIN